VIHSAFVDKLKPYITPVTHCPEVEIGLGVPRKTLRIEALDKEMKKLRLVQPETGIDFTAKMRKYTCATLDSLPVVDGFILKGKSPSSGFKDVKIYPGKEGKHAPLTTKGSGFFGGEAYKRFSHLAFEDEGRLNDPKIRDHFLKKLFTIAGFRAVRKRGGISGLMKFQQDNKLLFMSYSQKYMRVLGNIAATAPKKAAEPAFTAYEAHLYLLFDKIYTEKSVINTVMHAFGYFKEKLGPKEKAFFLRHLDKYRQGKEPLGTVVSLLRSYITRFDEKYLETQAFFEPYPEELAE